jgi:hypothetical protein
MLTGKARKSKVSTTEGKVFEKHGLKFHISLPEMDGEKYNTGWDLIAKVLMQHNVLLFKIVKPGIIMSDNPDQRGKDIIIYADENPEKRIKDWTDIFTTITSKEQKKVFGLILIPVIK